MTVTKPDITAMPQETDEKEIPVMQLGNDILLSVFDRRLAERDPWLRDVVASGWDEAAELPNDEIAQFVVEQDETTYTVEQDEDREVCRAYEELSAGKQEIWKTAEDNFGQGTQADPWTKPDLVELVSVEDNTVGRYIRDMNKSSDKDHAKPFRFTGEKDGNAKKYKVEDSYRQTVTADGGRRWVHDWDSRLEQLEKRDLLSTTSNEPRDWFAAENWDEWLDFVRKNQEISDCLRELARIQERQLDRPSSVERARERAMKRAREHLYELVELLREMVYLLRNLVQTAYNSQIMWMNQHSKSESQIQPKSNRPSVKLERARKKTDAKQYALLDTYVRPLLDVVPAHNTSVQALHKHGDRVYEFIGSMGAWLTWVDSCCRDVLDYGDPVATEDVVSGDATAFKQVLQNEWAGDPEPEAHNGNDEWHHESAVPWPDLLQRSSQVRGQEWTEASAMTGLENLSRAGLEDEDTAWQGVYVYDATPGPPGLHGECEPEVVLIEESERWGRNQLSWYDDEHLKREMMGEFRM